MPACRECNWFNKHEQKCSLNIKPRCAIRNCIHAIAIDEIKSCNGKVLEVGYGVWKTPRREIRKKPNCQWFGIDPRWKTVPEIGEYKSTVGKMPFEDNFFDYVFAFDTMEHWMEYGEHPTNGLREINRVLKPGGIILITVPIHLHGGREFIIGDIQMILSYFMPNLWTNLQYEEWRKDYDPLPPILNYEKYHKDIVYKFSSQKIPSVWTLKIRAIKVVVCDSVDDSNAKLVVDL